MGEYELPDEVGEWADESGAVILGPGGRITMPSGMTLEEFFGRLHFALYAMRAAAEIQVTLDEPGEE